MHPRELSGHSRHFTNWLISTYQGKDINSNVVQYCNERMNQHLHDFSERLIITLNPNKTYLNIGTGIGMLEHIAKQNGIHMKTAEQPYKKGPNGHIAYKWWTEKLEIPIDYVLHDYYTNFVIEGPDAKFDEIIATRFGPFQAGHIEPIPQVFSVLKQYAPHLRIFDWEVDPNLLKYFMGNYKVEYLNSQPAGKRALRIIL